MKRCSERLELLGYGQDFKRGQCQKGWNQIERGGIRPLFPLCLSSLLNLYLQITLSVNINPKQKH